MSLALLRNLSVVRMEPELVFARLKRIEKFLVGSAYGVSTSVAATGAALSPSGLVFVEVMAGGVTATVAISAGYVAILD